MTDAGLWRRFAVAAALSGVAHALVVAYGHFELPEAPADRMPVAVRIVEAPPRALPVPHQPRVVQRHTVRAQRGVRVAEAAPIASPIPAAVGDPDAAPTDGTPVVETAEAPPPEPVAAAAEPELPQPEPPVVAEPELPARMLPRKGRITYDLVYGRDRFPVGRTIQTWEVDRGRYQLASRSETVGLVDMIRSQSRTYSSRGAITRDGLKPEAFKAGRDRGRGLEEATAEFDWASATVKLRRANESRQEKLPPKSQDLLSFVFQLALDPPPPGRMTQVVTNGSHIEVYDLDVRPEEKIETPLGIMRALPIRQVRKGNEESIELWLATEYRYLPVRLRFYDRQGEPQGEQIVADIRLIEN